MLDGLTEGFSNVVGQIKTSIGNLFDLLADVGDWLVSGFKNVVDSITDIPEKIGNLLKDLFVPDENYFDNKFDNMLKKFEFVKAIHTIINTYGDYFKSIDVNEPPKVVISLDNADSKYNYGDSVNVLDLSWFAKYRSSVHNILRGIMWFLFVWNLFKELPNIINGGSGGLADYGIANERSNNAMAKFDNEVRWWGD